MFMSALNILRFTPVRHLQSEDENVIILHD